jgi:hypothetical protein
MDGLVEVRAMDGIGRGEVDGFMYCLVSSNVIGATGRSPTCERLPRTVPRRPRACLERRCLLAI